MENKKRTERTAATSRPPWVLPSLWGSVAFLVLSLAAAGVAGSWLFRSGAELNAMKSLRPALLRAPDAPEGAALVAPPVPSLRAQPLGPRAIAFRLLAPAAQAVFVGGSFNDFNAAQYPLTRRDDGVWETEIPLPPGRYAYKFKVDGEWLLDPTNPERSPAPKESSLLEVH